MTTTTSMHSSRPAGGPGRERLELAKGAVSKKFGRRTVVQPISLVLEPGERVGVVGESGSGKSTFGRMLAGLERPSAGRVLLHGRDVHQLLATQAGRLEFRREVQMISQDTTSSFDPLGTVRRSLRTPAQLLAGYDRSGADAAIDQLVDEMGLPAGIADRMPHELSGGQRQRLAIVRALVVRPRLLICDEVVSALDVSVQGAVLNLLKTYCSAHSAGIVFISHGLPATAFITEQLIVMLHGRVVEHGPTQEVLENPQSAYTRLLVAASGGHDQPIISAGDVTTKSGDNGHSRTPATTEE